jgi:deoxyribonuclease V
VTCDWPTTIAEARAVQESLRARVEVGERATMFREVAGVDVHVAPATGLTWAAIAVVDLATLELRASALAAVPAGFPYVPGFLSFREIPAAVAALRLLARTPDLLMVDGHGIAHPRRLGIATHLGVLTGLPSVGVAKSRLVGRHDEPGATRGSRTTLSHQGEVLGVVLRSRARARPLYVSPGHLVSLDQAVRLVEATLTGYRLPEPTRLADKLSRMHP